MPIPNGTTSVAELKDSLEVLTFDLYGTVVDMQIHRIMHVANHAFDCIGARLKECAGHTSIGVAAPTRTLLISPILSSTIFWTGLSDRTSF